MPTAFLNFDAHLVHPHLYDPFAFCIVYKQGRNQWTKRLLDETKLFASDFLENIIENPGSEGKCYFVAFLWPKIRCTAPQC